MVRKIGVAQIKARLAEVLRGVEQSGQRVIVERRGRPVAVIQPYDPEAFAPDRRHWAEELEGVAGDIEDFEEVLEEVVGSRSSARPRPVDFDDER